MLDFRQKARPLETTPKNPEVLCGCWQQFYSYMNHALVRVSDDRLFDDNDVKLYATAVYMDRNDLK